jgi:hypothetical protein
MLRLAVLKKTHPCDWSHRCFHLADVRSRMVNMNMSLAGSLRGAQKESTVSRLLRGVKDDGEGG